MQKSVKVFPAANGDCFLICVETQSGYKHILVDGGRGVICHLKLKKQFKYLEENKHNINLLVLTHIDDDHIAGILKLYQNREVNTSIIEKVWFNSGNVISSQLSGSEAAEREILMPIISKKKSVKQGMTLEAIMQNSNSWGRQLIFSGQKHQLHDIEIDIVSPDLQALQELDSKWEDEMRKLQARRVSRRKMSSITDYHKTFDELCTQEFEEDTSVFNRSSIAFLLKYQNYKILMLGDAHPSIVVDSLKNLGYSEKNKLKVDIVKVSHHGSKKNTSIELLNILDCTNFIVSTDGRKHGLPNKQSLVRIVKAMNKPVRFYFNYSSMNKIFSAKECEDYNITCMYLNDNNDYTVRD